MLLLFLSVMVLLKNFITSLAGKEQIPVRLELYIWHFVCRDCRTSKNTLRIVSHKVSGIEAYLNVFRQRKLLS